METQKKERKEIIYPQKPKRDTQIEQNDTIASEIESLKEGEIILNTLYARINGQLVRQNDLIHKDKLFKVFS